MNTKSKTYLNNFNKKDELLPTSSGFISFSDLNTGEYFFRFNNEKGKPILYSEAFEDAEKRDTRISLVIKNAQARKRYKKEKEGKQYTISLRSGNHKELARSQSYKSEAKAEKAIEYLMGNITEPIIATTPVKKQAVEPKKVKKQAEESKYSFRLELYPQENEPLAGIVTNVVNKKNTNFIGIDEPILINFIKSQLSEADRKKEARSVAKKVEKTKTETVEQPKEEPTINFKENLIVELVENINAKSQKNWEVNTPFDIRFKLKEGIKLPENGKIKMKILLNSIQDQATQNQLITEIEFSEDNIAYFEGLQKINRTGIYRIKAIATQNNYFGTTAFNVF